VSRTVEGYDAAHTGVTTLGPQDDEDIALGLHGVALSDDSTALFIGTADQLRSLAQRFTAAADSLGG
jgi:hypothetical protein